MKTNKILPPRIFQLAILAMLLIHFLLPGKFLYESPLRYLGLVPILMGIWLNLKTDRLFKLHATTIKPFEESSVLIETGPFILSRNPIYLGMVLIMLGGALISGSILSFLVPFIQAILLHYLYILPEEKQLKAIFGEEYQLYSREVPRWI